MGTQSRGRRSRRLRGRTRSNSAYLRTAGAPCALGGTEQRPSRPVPHARQPLLWGKRENTVAGTQRHESLRDAALKARLER